MAERVPTFDHVWHSVWRLDASPAAVWQAVSDPESWPFWWPYVAQASLLRRGDAEGLGSVHRFVWRTRLPYRVRFEAETVAVRCQQLLVARAHGDVDGRGTWRLAAEAAGTRLEYVWEIRLTRPWMRRLAHLAVPLFKWNHDAVMRAGGDGLARHLAQPGRPA